MLFAGCGSHPTFVFEARWGSDVTRDESRGYPSGLAVDADGNGRIAEYFAGRLKRFTPEGELLTIVGSWGSGDGQFMSPAGIAIDDSEEGKFLGPVGLAVDAQDNVYVADYESAKVEVFTRRGVLVTQFGERGIEDDQLIAPCGIAVDAAGSVYVLDALLLRVLKLARQDS